MKTPRRKAAAPEQSDQLTEAQTKALLEEWERRFRRLVEKWRLCPDRQCRRRRRCLGPEFVCTRKSAMRPPTERQHRRLMREFMRKPVRS